MGMRETAKAACHAQRPPAGSGRDAPLLVRSERGLFARWPGPPGSALALTFRGREVRLQLGFVKGAPLAPSRSWPFVVLPKEDSLTQAGGRAGGRAPSSALP